MVAACTIKCTLARHPYEWGGTEQSGVDCSGFVWANAQDRFICPWSGNRAISCIWASASASSSSVGGLVFFRIRGGMHVGFYDTGANFCTLPAARASCAPRWTTLTGTRSLPGASPAERI
ncbi:NlpC/P60 family protein [Raoultella planticola]|uniref:NlpC/P60 family protein n=1 Tax=Raoultella planticola TaxID=575 RepID=UPI001D0D606D|nr:NlpC/P60 family protein [Raoultella planticola]